MLHLRQPQLLASGFRGVTAMLDVVRQSVADDIGLDIGLFLHP